MGAVPSLSRPLIFQHIPKAGGSTLRDILNDYCHAHHIRCVIPCYNSLVCTTNEAGLILPHMLNNTACAVAFGGHWIGGALGLLAVLVQVDLGTYGPVACKRWPWLTEVWPELETLPRAPYIVSGFPAAAFRQPQLAVARNDSNAWLKSMGLSMTMSSRLSTSMLNLLSSHTTCVMVFRGVEERMVSHYNHFSYASRGSMQDFAAQHGIRAAIAASGGGVQLYMSSAGTMKLDFAKQVIDNCNVVGISSEYHLLLHKLYDEIGPDVPCVQTADELPHLNSAVGQHVTVNESNINKCAPALFAQWTQALEQEPDLRQEQALFEYAREHSSLPLQGSCPR